MKLAMTRRRRRFRKKRCDAGSVTVEFAIMLPMLATMIVGILDFGEWEFRQTELEAATRAGAQWAFGNPTPPAGGGIDTTGIKNAVVNYAAQAGLASTDVTVTTFCTCADNTQGTGFSSSTCPQVSSSSNPCSAKTDKRVFEYVAVQLTQPFSITWGGTWSTTLKAGTVTRVQ